jgi:hypothetical protein
LVAENKRSMFRHALMNGVGIMPIKRLRAIDRRNFARKRVRHRADHDRHFGVPLRFNSSLALSESPSKRVWRLWGGVAQSFVTRIFREFCLFANPDSPGALAQTALLPYACRSLLEPYGVPLVACSHQYQRDNCDSLGGRQGEQNAVSHVFTGMRPVSLATRRKFLRVMEKLDFQLNFVE